MIHKMMLSASKTWDKFNNEYPAKKERVKQCRQSRFYICMNVINNFPCHNEIIIYENRKFNLKIKLMLFAPSFMYFFFLMQK